MSHSRLNKIYQKMKERCYDVNNNRYNIYGGRGIKICDEWINKELTGIRNQTKGYLAFKVWALSNGYREDLTIDRIDNDKGYSPDNCRWVTPKEQSNNRRSNHLILYKGESHNLKTWCEMLNLNYDRTERRINKLHWSVEKAFETECWTPKHNFKEMSKQELAQYYHNNYMKRREKALEVGKIYYEKHKEELKEKAKLRYKRRVSKVKGDLYDL